MLRSRHGYAHTHASGFYMLEGGIAGGREVRAVREGKEGAREGERNQLLLIHCD